MPRLVPAAQQLLDQVGEARTSMKKVTLGDPDGLDRIRSITFDATTSRWLVPILDAVRDSRIKEIEWAGKGRAKVTFVSDYRADFKAPFPLTEVGSILND